MGNKISIESKKNYNSFFDKLSDNISFSIINYDENFLQNYINGSILYFQYVDKTIYVYEIIKNVKKLIDILRCSVDSNDLLKFVKVNDKNILISDGKYFNIFFYNKSKHKLEFIKKMECSINESMMKNIKKINFCEESIYILFDDNAKYTIISLNNGIISKNKLVIDVHSDDKIRFSDDLKYLYISNNDCSYSIILENMKNIVHNHNVLLKSNKYFSFNKQILISDYDFKKNTIVLINKQYIDNMIRGKFIKIMELTPIYNNDITKYFIIFVLNKKFKAYIIYGHTDYNIVEYELSDKEYDNVYEVKDDIFFLDNHYVINMNRLTKSLLIETNINLIREKISKKLSKEYYRKIILRSGDIELSYCISKFLSNIFMRKSLDKINLDINIQITFFDDINSFKIFINLLEGIFSSQYVIDKIFEDNNDNTNKNMFYELIEHFYIYCNIILINNESLKFFLSYIVSELVNRYYVYYDDDKRLRDRFNVMISEFTI
jgi:hypothetical protein